jgi:hypothetical protein
MHTGRVVSGASQGGIGSRHFRSPGKHDRAQDACNGAAGAGALGRSYRRGCLRSVYTASTNIAVVQGPEVAP